MNMWYDNDDVKDAVTKGSKKTTTHESQRKHVNFKHQAETKKKVWCAWMNLLQDWHRVTHLDKDELGHIEQLNATHQAPQDLRIGCSCCAATYLSARLIVRRLGFVKSILDGTNSIWRTSINHTALHSLHRLIETRPLPPALTPAWLPALRLFFRCCDWVKPLDGRAGRLGLPHRTRGEWRCPTVTPLPPHLNSRGAHIIGL